jgi:chorismate dehydratase
MSSAATNQPLRVAAVSFLNSVPLVWGLVHGPHRARFAVNNMLPSLCADALRAPMESNAAADAGIIPSIEYQRIAGLKVVPGLAVASAGPVRSVLLISKVPVQQIRSVALDTSSRTSVCLAQILMARHYHIAPLAISHAPNLKSMLARCDAAMMIGDPALASDFPGLEVRDLADDWREMTGLPFVFAVWAVRTAAAQPGLIAAFQESAAYALANLDSIIPEERARTGLAPELIRSYLTENIDFTLGERNLAGLRLFFELAHELGHTPGNRTIQFVE